MLPTGLFGTSEQNKKKEATFIMKESVEDVCCLKAPRETCILKRLHSTTVP